MTVPSGIPDPADTRLPHVLTALLERRYHGAANVRGVRYQLLYFVWRAFDLYDDRAPDELIGEGLEDVDLRSVTSGNEYVQVKGYERGLPWRDFVAILRGFLPVFRSDPEARFTIVTSTGLSRDVRAVDGFVRGARSLPPDLARTLAREFAGDESSSVDALLRQLRFVILPEERLRRDLLAAVAERFAVTIGNEELYVGALFAELASRAGNRVAVRRHDVELVRVRVEEAVNRGTVNPAVRDRFVAPLAFTPTANTEDYYEGRGARPDHIAAGLDVRRPDLAARIGEILSRVQACIVLASSGQGKSTAALRHAADHYHPEAVIAVRVCQRESEAGQIARFLRSRLRLGLPLLVVIDGLGRRTRLWYRLAAELADAPVSFLLTAREEDWFRYAGQTTGFTWDVVKPQLGLLEAERIFAELQRRGRVAAGVPSARWAFERVREWGLLIEFIYLVTHGRLLTERLEEQVRVIGALREDPGKLEALRLVSVAQRYGARVRTVDLAHHARFRGDPGQGIDALVGEYLVCDDGYCEGLHPVRSEHLVALLHGSLPVEATVERLVGFLDGDELDLFVVGAFADPELDATAALAVLVGRCSAAPPALLARMAQACFEAEERRYFLRHRPLFDQAYDLLGDSGVFMLAAEVAPGRPAGALQPLSDTEGFAPAATALQALARQFEPRTPGRRLEHRLLTDALQSAAPQCLASDLPALGVVLGWCHAADIKAPVLAEALAATQWRETLLDLPIADAAAGALALSRSRPDEYHSWTQAERRRIVGCFKRGTRTFAVAEEDGAVLIRFPVKSGPDAPAPNEQAIDRLFTLHRLLPDYREYRSEGLYPFGEEAQLQHDDTRKSLPPENIWQEVDTNKNAAWIRVCQEAYAADSLTTWLDAWMALRREAHDFVRRADQFCVARWRGQRVDNLAEGLRRSFEERLLPQLRHAPGPPRTLSKADQDRLRTLSSRWSSHFLFFVRQLMTNYPDEGSPEEVRLLSYLSEATLELTDLDQAFAHAAEFLGMRQQEADSSAEATTYRRLAELLEFWFASPRQRLPQPHASAREWRRARDAAFVAAVRRTLNPLERGGQRFIYPTGPLPLDTPPLVGLCLGFEVRDFAEQGTEISAIAIALGGDPPPSHFIYLLPVVGGRCVQRRAFRISTESARELAAGRVPQQLWFFPVALPRDVDTALPGVDLQPLPEQELLQGFREAIGGLARPLRLSQMAMAHLAPGDPDVPSDAQLLRDIADEVAADTGPARAAVTAALSRLESFIPTERGRPGWQLLIERCRTLVAEVEQSPDTLPSLLADQGLQEAEYRYMNATYLDRRD